MGNKCKEDTGTGVGRGSIAHSTTREAREKHDREPTQQDQLTKQQIEPANTTAAKRAGA